MPISRAKGLNDQSKCRNKPDVEPIQYMCVFLCMSTAVRDGADAQNLECHVELTDFLYKPL